ncbi:MAG: FAD:protein FMN transferase [Bacteroidales bacterium]|nr:FAD:protein FMN transferase [Bacteroidales bacterium]
MKSIKAHSFFLGVVICISCATACSHGDYYAISGFAQGGTYIVKADLSPVRGLGVNEVRAGIDSVLLVIDNTLSGYNKGSDLSRFNNGEEIEVNEVFSGMYRRAREIWEYTEGAVDCAAGPLFDAWGFGFTGEEFPSDEKVRSILSGCGMGRLEEELTSGKPAGLVAREGGPLPRLNYNAVAQGYSCDLVAEYLKGLGVESMMINIGGEIFCSGDNPSGRRWTIGIDRPEEGNMVSGEKIEAVFHIPEGSYGVVTSGNYRKFHEKDGRRYSHTIDPRTGYPAERSILSATILAPDATLADGLATFAMVVGVEEASEFISREEGIEGCLIYDEDGEMKIWTSEGFLLD